jgi:hypothetical protein
MAKAVPPASLIELAKGCFACARASGQVDDGTGSSKLLGNGFTDSATGTGDHGDLAC